MKRAIQLTVACVVVVMVAPAAKVQAGPVFHGLGDLSGGIFDSGASAVSADGSTVVGRGRSATNEAFLWTQADGMAGLGFLPNRQASRGFGVSANGAVVVGSSSIFTEEAFRWESGAMAGLGFLPSAQPGALSAAFGVSADGSVIVGHSTSVSGQQAFRWEGGVMTGLGSLPGGTFSQGRGVSADGSIIAGFGNSTFGGEAFRWEGGGMTGLGDLPGGTFSSIAWAISADGSTIVGQSRSSLGDEAFRWTAADSMVGLGFLGDGLDVSADGSIVAGRSNGSAILWDEINGMRHVADVLVASGVNLSGWTLGSATGISDDGRIIVGEGINPDGNPEAWLAQLDQNPVPEPSSLALFGIGAIGLIAFHRRKRKQAA